MFQVAARDESNQKNGLVVVDYDVGRLPLDRFDESNGVEVLCGDANGGFDFDLCHRIILMIRNSVPIRVSGVHMCFSNHQWQRIHDMRTIWFGKDIRLRMKRHDGSHTQCRYNLMCHGIPAQELKLNEDGTLKTESHFRWIHCQELLEEAIVHNVRT